MMADYEVIHHEEVVERYGDAVTREIVVSYPASMTIRGGIDGHASVLDSFTGFFRLAAPDGTLLVNESVTGRNRVFLPLAETRHRQIDVTLPNVPPGVYVVQIGGTNQYSGGRVTLAWDERRPVSRPLITLPGLGSGDGDGDASQVSYTLSALPAIAIGTIALAIVGGLYLISRR